MILSQLFAQAQAGTLVLRAADAAWAPWTVRVLCSVTLVWLAAGAIAFSLRTASAAMRHRIWALSVIAALALPVLTAALPEWRAGWIDLGASDVRARDVSRLAGRRGDAFSQGSLHQEPIGEKPLVGAPTRAPTRAAAILANPATVAENQGDSLAAMSAPRFGRLGLLAFWAAPAALALVWTACSMLAARRLVRRATIIDDETCKEMLRGLLPAGGKLAAVQLRESEATVSPLCVGWRRPAIVLPCGWRDWPRGHLAAALAHELAHVVRRDVAWQLLAHTTCAIYWFHPLAWLAAWRMRVEREAACDDWALAAGQPPVGYARVLLDFAEQLSRRHPAPPASAVAMAGCRGFERRIRAILSRRRRRDPVGRSAAWLLAAAMLGVTLIGGIVSPLASSQARAEPGAAVKKTIQPSHFALGKVRAGSVVEVSARVFGDATAVGGLAVKVSPPAFFELERIEVADANTPNMKGKTACNIYFSVDTSKIGQFSGIVKTELGECIAELPVSVEVVERPAGYPNVLFVSTPFDRFSTSDGSDFDTLVELVGGLKISANYRHKLPKDITHFHVILLAADELCNLSAWDSTRLKTFVATGGRLIIAANAFFNPTVPKANELLKDYGLEIDHRDAAQELVVTEFADDPLMAGVRRLAFFRPSLVRVTDDAKAKILVPVKGGGFAAVSRNRSKGEIIVLTQSLWWSWLATGDGNHDNARLLANMLVPE